MLVKICANKTIEDAKMCLKAGADIIGILVGKKHFSTDFVDAKKAEEICNYVNGKCKVCVVTHLTNAEEIIDLCKNVGNDFLQLHSEIKDFDVKKIIDALPNLKIVRLIHIDKNGEILTNLNDVKLGDFYLIDSINTQTNQVGGTGLTHDWNVSSNLIKNLNKPTFLAGGLNPENISTAIKKCNPFGVDVNSGVKTNGMKDYNKIYNFVNNAKQTQIL